MATAIIYKDVSFFNAYFSKLDDFKLVKNFEQVNDKEGKRYRGEMDSIGTIHPIHIIVEIPLTFPHSKLTFYTKSLKGYPHLIWNPERKDSWFCLNTPFAESAEGQLEQELMRLRGWIKRSLRPERPAIIDDPEVINALRETDAYAWENIDEMNEYRQDARVTFVGDFASNPENFKEKQGKLHCVRNGSKRYFVLQEDIHTNTELPYIIVSEAPKDLSDFYALKKQYAWDDKTCGFLLPGVYNAEAYLSSTSYPFLSESGKGKFSLKRFFDGIPEDEVLPLVQPLLIELGKDTPYLSSNTRVSKTNTSESFVLKIIPEKHRDLLKKHIEELVNEIKKEHEFRPFKDSLFSTSPIDPEDPEYDETLLLEEAQREYEIKQWQYGFDTFVLGVLSGERLFWYCCSTNNASKKACVTTYDCVISHPHISEDCACTMDIECAQQVTSEMYFGRGRFAQEWSGLKIGIVGLGAVGSMVAESLARSGVSAVGLWDDDIVEPGNICRSSFTINNLGDSKIESVKRKILSINPFIKLSDINISGYYYTNNRDDVNALLKYKGSFYGSINYNSQEEAVKILNGYDLIIDCTASNEMLHFLSYAVPDKKLLSLCITNHAQNLLCMSSRDGNIFEQRKLYLSKIEQDTKNFYVEGTGCYSPTFLATYSDIASLVNLAVRKLNEEMSYGELMHSTIWSYSSRGVVAETMHSFRLKDYDIRLIVGSETLMDGEEMCDVEAGEDIGYLLGGYSADGKMIMLSHFIEAQNAEQSLSNAYTVSNGIIDYIGDYAYSSPQDGVYDENAPLRLAAKAEDKSINTQNPMLAIRNTDGSISFFLYINGDLVPFIEE